MRLDLNVQLSPSHVDLFLHSSVSYVPYVLIAHSYVFSHFSGSVFIGLLSDILKVRAIPTTSFLLLSVPVVSARHLTVNDDVGIVLISYMLLINAVAFTVIIVSIMFLCG